MRWLKLIVISLGLLIIFALMLIGYGFYKKSKNPNWKLVTLNGSKTSIDPNPASITSTDKKSVEDIKLDIPKDCSIISTQISQNYLVILTGKNRVCQKVFVFNLEHHQLIKTYSIKP